MSVRIADPQADPALPEAELLARLGLRPGASNSQVEAAHDEILDYLADAPTSLREWVRARVTEVDEAYGLLNASTSGSAAAPEARRAPPAKPAPAPKSAAGGNGRPGSKAQVRVRGGEEDADLFDDAFGGGAAAFVGEEGGATVMSRRDRRPQKAERRRGGRAGVTAPGQLTISVSTVRKAGVGLALAAALVVGGFAIYQFGQGSVPRINGTPAPQASAATLDAAAVAAAMAKLQTNPNDVATLQELANLYYAASDYATARTWLDKVLAIEPRNIAALLGYGAAAYNLGDNTTAEAKWRAVIAIDPKNIEAHYDLGFMYFSATPPNVAGVKAEWNAVLALDPNDDLKTYITTHLANLDKLSSPSPGASGAPSGSAAPSGSPASAAPSPAPSAAPTPAAS